MIQYQLDPNRHEVHQFYTEGPDSTEFSKLLCTLNGFVLALKDAYVDSVSIHYAPSDDIDALPEVCWAATVVVGR